MSTALITGITGQDGYYLSKFLLERGYQVHGTIRRTSLINTYRIDELIYKYKNQLTLHYSDLLDPSSLSSIINTTNPDEIYNLAAQSHVAVSFKNPLYTTQTGTVGNLSILEAIRSSKKEIKFYQASSSEMYGGEEEVLLNEDSVLKPKSPYAASKTFAHHMTQIYRDSYNMHCSNGILFNHESPRRGETFVTKKITKGVAEIHKGNQEIIRLGNLNAKRDWGHAKDFVYAQWLMMQQEEPRDYVIATGETHSVREFVELAFHEIDVQIEWQNSGIDEVGIDSSTGEIKVCVDEQYFRPSEVEVLLGNPLKAEKELGWQRQISFEELVSGMVKYDLEYNDFGGLEWV